MLRLTASSTGHICNERLFSTFMETTSGSETHIRDLGWKRPLEAITGPRTYLKFILSKRFAHICHKDTIWKRFPHNNIISSWTVSADNFTPWTYVQWILLHMSEKCAFLLSTHDNTSERCVNAAAFSCHMPAWWGLQQTTMSMAHYGPVTLRIQAGRGKTITTMFNFHRNLFPSSDKLKAVLK